ncbi:MAG: hypothetical protein RLZZ245_65, partial [Verrucomicrobiota bacterium]
MNTITLKIALLLLALANAFCALNVRAADEVRAGELRCEQLVDPVGIDVTQPRLSWQLASEQRGAAQTAYEILVASSADKLAPGNADLWASGKVVSDQSLHVRYAGKPLASRQTCVWKVRIWDERGKVSAWSRPATWSLGLLQPDDWRGQWIGRDEIVIPQVLPPSSWIWFPEGKPETAAPIGLRYFRRTFELPADRTIKRAEYQMV